MPDKIKKTDDFLRTINMHPEQTDMEELTAGIMAEMERGLSGEKSCLAMIPTYIGTQFAPLEGESVIVLDAGGTNLRTGLCTFTQGKPVLTQVEKVPMPGSRGEISADEFMEMLCRKILPLTEKSSRIGFSFSYPANIFSNRDGSIVRMNKELHIAGAEGLVLGRTMRLYLARLGVSHDTSFVLLNDTTAALLGGIAEHGLPRGGCAGLVLGTGFNTSCCESGHKITKLKSAEDMIINCETGSFNGAFRGEADLLTDRSSEIPGDHLLEKMMSGAYLGTVISNTAQLAEKTGLLSDNFAAGFEAFTLKETDEFLAGAEGRIAGMCRSGDEVVVRRIIECAYDRTARLLCANIAAMCLDADGGKSEKEPFVVFAEGSTFWNCETVRKKLEFYLNDFICGKIGRHAVVYRSEDATLKGAALSVFTLRI